MALASHVPASWDTILSTTMHNYRKTLTDNIFGSRVVLEYLMSKGRVKTIDGGISIVEPLLLGSGEADSYGPWDTIKVNPVGGISAAQFAWKQLYATIIINGLEEAQNNGKEQAINLIEAKVMQAEETLKNILSQMIWGTRGGAAKATDFDSLLTLVDNAGACGGITPAAAPAPENAWRSPILNTTTMVGTDAKGVTIPAANLPAAGTLDGLELERVLRKMFNLASDGGADHVDAIFGSTSMFDAYEASLTPQVRYTDTTKANLGFQNLMFKNVPIFWDPDAPDAAGAAVCLGLNSKYIGMTLHSERNFKQSPFTANLSGTVSAGIGAYSAGNTGTAPSGATVGVPAASTMDARVSFITTYGNMTTRERRRNFKITAMGFV